MAADGKWVRRTARRAADGVGATEWLEMGGEKKPLVMSDLGCADGCGRQMGAGNCADGCGRRGCNGVFGNGWGEEAAGDERPTAADGVGATEWLEMGGEKKPLVMSDLGCADGCGRQMGAENCAHRCGPRGCKGVTGNMEMGEEKKPLVMSGLGCADAVDGQWVQRTARMAADGVGATEWLEKKPLVMSEFGCADGCGRQMGAENCVDGCGRHRCNGVAGNG